MPNLEINLKNKLERAQKVAVLGVGSELRSDDAAGLLVAERLDKFFKSSKQRMRLKVLFGATAPENLTGEIKKFKPSHIIIVDSADLGKKPGTIALIEPEQALGVTFCTHQLPLKIMIDYLHNFLACQIILIGIQPKTVKFGQTISKEVKKSIEYISEIINRCLTKPYRII